MGVGLRSMSRSTWISWRIYCCSWLATSAAGTRLWKGCSWERDGCRGLEPYPFLWTARLIFLWVRFLERFGLPVPEVLAWNPWIPFRAFCIGGSSWPWVLAIQGSSWLSSECLGFGKGSLELSRHPRRGSLVQRLGPLSSLRWLLVRARAFSRPLAALLLCTTAQTVWLTRISISTRWPETCTLEAKVGRTSA